MEEEEGEVEEEGGGPGSRDSPAGQPHRERGEESLTGRWPERPAGAAATTNIRPSAGQLRNTNTGGAERRSLNRQPGGNSRDIAVTSGRESRHRLGSGER